MPPTIGGIGIDPQGISLEVSITPAAKVYTDRAGTSLASFPASISSKTTYYVSASQPYTISCLYDGAEIASANGTTVTVQIDPNQVFEFAPSVDLPAEDSAGHGGLVRHRTMLDFDGSTSYADNQIPFKNAAASGFEVDVTEGVWNVASNDGSTQAMVSLPSDPDTTVHLKGRGREKTVINFEYAAASATTTNYGFKRVADGADITARTILEGMTLHGQDLARATNKTVLVPLELSGGAGPTVYEIGPIELRDLETYYFQSHGLIDTDSYALATRVDIDHCWVHDIATNTLATASQGGSGLFSGSAQMLFIGGNCLVERVGQDETVDNPSGIWGIGYINAGCEKAVISDVITTMCRGGLKLGSESEDYNHVSLSNVTIADNHGSPGIYLAVNPATDKYIRNFKASNLTIQNLEGSYVSPTPSGVVLFNGVDGAQFVNATIDIGGQQASGVDIGNVSGASVQQDIRNVQFTNLRVKGQSAAGAGFAAFKLTANASTGSPRTVDNVSVSGIMFDGHASTPVGHGILATASNGGTITNVRIGRGRIGTFATDAINLSGVTGYDISNDLDVGSGAITLTNSTASKQKGYRTVAVFSYAGPVSTGTGQFRWYNDTGKTATITAVRASVGTAPTGATLIVDVNKDGTTIYTTQANRPTIAISGNTATANSPDVTTVAAGSYLTVDRDQVGSTVAGSDMSVEVVMFITDI